MDNIAAIVDYGPLGLLALVIAGFFWYVRSVEARATTREKAEQVAAKDNIVLEAQRRADQILSQGRADAEATRRDADDYVLDTLIQLQDNLEKTLNQIRNGVQTLQQDRMRDAMPASSGGPEKTEN